MATLKDVSEYAGVSQATVSRYINGTTRISSEKRVLIEKAIKLLDYRPNKMLPSQQQNRFGSVGLMMPSLGGPFSSAVLQGLEEKLHQFDYHALAISGGTCKQDEEMALNYLLNKKIDGLILLVQHLSDDTLIELVKQRIPLVLINRCVPEIRHFCIEVDNELGGKLATDHLISAGHQHIACITGPLQRSDARARLQGYRKALEESGLHYCEDIVVEAEFSEESGYKAMKKLQNRGYDFTALFVCNDHMAIGVQEYLAENKLCVPDDLSVVGFDNVDIARFVMSGLTTIHFPIEEMCAQAVTQMVRSLNQTKTSTPQKLTPRLIARHSVAASIAHKRAIIHVV